LKGQPRGFIERTLAGFSAVLELGDTAARVADRRGWMQRLDPRVKLGVAVAFICIAVAARHLALPLVIFVLAGVTAISTGLPLRLIAARIWIPVLCFSGLVALPALFTTPGEALSQSAAGRYVTVQGLRTAGFLLVRAETSATLMALVILSTSWTHLLKALRLFRIPATAVAILGMTHRYIFLFFGMASDAFEARRARNVGRLDRAQQRQMAATAVGALFGRSIQLSGDVFSAMEARGYRGEVRTVDEFRMQAGDWTFLAGAICCGIVLVIVDRWMP
jgi:cobalt ECF transporter T component CbiQ